MIFLSHPFGVNIILTDQVKDLPLIPVNVLFSVVSQPAYAGDTELVHPHKGAHVKGVLVTFGVVHCVVAARLEASLKYRIQHIFTPSAPERCSPQ